MIDSASTHEGPVRDSVREYAALRPTLVEPTLRCAELITSLLDDTGINYLTVTSRTKTVASFAAKAARIQAADPAADPIAAITDAVGVRVITYVQEGVTAVAALFEQEFQVLDDRDMGLETAALGNFGYSSRHMLVRVPDEAPEGFEDIAGAVANVQLRTVLQHSWAEFEHDIRYKGTIPESLAPDLNRRFTLAAGLLELADREFSSIQAQLQADAPRPDLGEDPQDPRIAAADLAAFLDAQYPDAGWSKSEHYGWISGLLLELGITSLAELEALLTSVDIDAMIAHMGYRHPTGAVRRLDDALLGIFGEQYVGLKENAHRVPSLQARLAKLTPAPVDDDL
ncbi:GTP pyrophosphokinase [Nocardioides yefusunii]|uniref:GTP pyrophosphokinase family protein n=1 Tax=Nocardioides yefusunii TaxID=2500546 RepID=A0ABW1QTE9_9ACTN|nr:GTP pyrophosphokinase [Nocardioides yefusunii]